MEASLRFYLDENVPVAVANQLRRQGIEAVTALDLGVLGDSDINHLRRASEMGYVLCTYDADYLELASGGMEHAGIVFGRAEQHWIGEWVKGLILCYAVYTAQDMRNRVEYL
ncbi:MAG: DUF5615 family PIN-like protein [Anaerolineae bacterium]|nr:DUF5615 family PIN-like protein [Anaerolineae bacterium]